MHLLRLLIVQRNSAGTSQRRGLPVGDGAGVECTTAGNGPGTARGRWPGVGPGGRACEVEIVPQIGRRCRTSRREGPRIPLARPSHPVLPRAVINVYSHRHLPRHTTPIYRTAHHVRRGAAQHRHHHPHLVRLLALSSLLPLALIDITHHRPRYSQPCPRGPVRDWC